LPGHGAVALPSARVHKVLVVLASARKGESTDQSSEHSGLADESFHRFAP
jgi:hypothetical protein